MPRRAPKGGSGSKKPRGEDEEELQRREEASPPLPRAGDTARQIGAGFFKMADVIDECPPLAKLFEGGFLERRFQEVFQMPSALMAGSGSEAAAAVSGDCQGTESPAGFRKRSPVMKGADKAGGGKGGTSAGAGAAVCSSPPRKGVVGSSPKCKPTIPPEEGVRGRRGTRGSGLGVDAGTWPGLEQALRASEDDTAKEVATASSGKVCKGLGMRSRPVNPTVSDESAKRSRKPSPPVPKAFGFPPAPPPRRAAAEALHRMSSLSSSSSLPGSSSSSSSSPAAAAAAAAIGSPRKLTPAAAAAAVGGAGVAVGSKEVMGCRAGGGGGEGAERKAGKKTGKTSTKDVAAAVAKKAKKGGSAGSKAAPMPDASMAEASGTGGHLSRGPGAVTLKDGGADPGEASSGAPAKKGGSAGSKATSMAGTIETGASGAGVDLSRGSGAVTLKDGGADIGEASSGAPRRRKSAAETLSRLDARVFRFVEEGKCREDWCEVREKAHCHRGPGCDCTRNSDTYMWPAELQKMMRHQERHHEWNTKPAFGKRVMVEFEEGTYYPGTINTEGDSAKDRNHSKGRWSVLFDDCTKDRFFDGADDVMISNRPRPALISEDLRDYYLNQENGRRLLAGVRIIPENRTESGDGTAREESPADNAGATKKRGDKKHKKKHERRKSLKESTPRNQSAPEREEGGCASREQASSKTAGSNSKAISESGAGGSGTSGSESKQSLAVDGEGEETETDEEREQGDEKGGRGWKEERGGGEDLRDDVDGGHRGEDDGGGSGGGSLKSGSINKSGKRSKKKRRSDSESTRSSKAGERKKKGSRHHRRGGEAEEDVGGGVGAGVGDNCGSGGWEDVESCRAKRKKRKKARKEQQHQQSISDFSSNSIRAGDSGMRGDCTAKDTCNPGAPNAELEYKIGPDATLPSAFDPNPRATVVAESGRGVGDVDEGNDGVEPGWVSAAFQSGTSPLPPTPQQPPPADQNHHHHEPKGSTISEEETTEEEDIETARTMCESRGRASPYHEGTATAAAETSSSDGFAGGARGAAAAGGSGGGGGTVNVVPVVAAQSSASAADRNTLAAAHVMVSGLGV
ncbi:unnamed protein product [Pylaiella littoralis]